MTGPTIWKYELAPKEVQTIRMPQGARLLHVAGQEVAERGAGFARRGIFPMLWAEVDPEAPMEERLIGLVGTGWSAPDDSGTYVGTAICGSFVWHIYDGGARAIGGEE